ncbi:regulatory protein RecX [Thiomicrospira cyclica]|uniref:Regulatory protein RecX n=1 Tax=Thiomicrospira cyclica (strain DSM 14477 / JCM 11371 / ALM1) TaxID=717773 RepID=F6DBP0_THICA|nr:regulatory protein RecX [Thiomicrospira cyclica]AEG31276.1 regulatory protein RecX [Thiomicrospira cyclica ALM1]
MRWPISTVNVSQPFNDCKVKVIVARAQGLLARREHGRKELAQKLRQKFSHCSQLETLLSQALDYCESQNWLSDQRYVESYLRMAQAKGQGELKCRQALLQSCGQLELIEMALRDYVQSSQAIAKQALEKKFGDTNRPANRKEFARRLRFLQGRGFSVTQCYQAFEAD